MDYLLPEQWRRDEDAAVNPASSTPSLSADRSISRPIRCPSLLHSSMSRCGHQPRPSPSSSASSSAAAAASVRYREADETALRACCRSSIPSSRLYADLRVAYVYSLPIHGQSWRRRNRSEQYSSPAYSSSPEPADIIRTMRQGRNWQRVLGVKIPAFLEIKCKIWSRRI